MAQILALRRTIIKDDREMVNPPKDVPNPIRVATGHKGNADKEKKEIFAHGNRPPTHRFAFYL